MTAPDYVIWKAVLHEPEQMVTVPQGSTILSAANQDEKITIWFHGDRNAPTEQRKLYVVGTGQEAPSPNSVRFIGTALFSNGHFVFHVFEQLSS